VCASPWDALRLLIVQGTLRRMARRTQHMAELDPNGNLNECTFF
jgi:hypothetical protein